jgi:hypothetical protein
MVGEWEKEASCVFFSLLAFRASESKGSGRVEWKCSTHATTRANLACLRVWPVAAAERSLSIILMRNGSTGGICLALLRLLRAVCSVDSSRPARVSLLEARRLVSVPVSPRNGTDLGGLA